MISSVPLNRPPMYSVTDSGGTLSPGLGPFGFAFEIKPFPLATSNRRPSAVTRTDVGYHPTGMKPNDRLFPGVATSKTATVLISAFATKSRDSSGDRARLLGVLPGGECGFNSAIKVSTVRPLAVSSTDTLLRFALATNKCRPERSRIISLGCSSVAHRPRIRLVFTSITRTADWSNHLT